GKGKEGDEKGRDGEGIGLTLFFFSRCTASFLLFRWCGVRVRLLLEFLRQSPVPAVSFSCWPPAAKASAKTWRRGILGYVGRCRKLSPAQGQDVCSYRAAATAAACHRWRQQRRELACRKFLLPSTHARVRGRLRSYSVAGCRWLRMISRSGPQARPSVASTALPPSRRWASSRA
ncbi:unnamed protein product, partial [Phaeothamnion confervicola]